MKTRTVIRPYVPATVSKVEVWLKKQASTGWSLQNHSFWIFTFVENKPCEREYFLYEIVDRPLGAYTDFYHAKVRYRQRKSTLLKKCNDNIFEVDLKKIDSEYVFYKLSRNTYYRTFYLRYLRFCFVGTAVSLLGCLFGSFILWPLLLIYLLLTLYALFSFLYLRKESK